MFRVVLQNRYAKDFYKFDQKGDKKRHRGKGCNQKSVFVSDVFFEWPLRQMRRKIFADKKG